MAVSINARCEYAWGKLPSSCFVSKSISSLKRFKWLLYFNRSSKYFFAFSTSPIFMRLLINQNVQTVKEDEGSPKSSWFLYRYNKPLKASSFSIAFTVFLKRSSFADTNPNCSISSTEASRYFDPYDWV